MTHLPKSPSAQPGTIPPGELGTEQASRNLWIRDPRRRLPILLMVTLLLSLAAGMIFYARRSPPQPRPVPVQASVVWQEQRLIEAQEALLRGDPLTSRQLAQTLFGTRMHLVDALLVAARASFQSGEPLEALGYYDRILPNDRLGYCVARLEAADVLVSLGDWDAAELRLREVLAVDATNFLAQDRLLTLLQQQGRTYRAAVEASRLLKSQTCSLQHLVLLGRRADVPAPMTTDNRASGDRPVAAPTARQAWDHLNAGHPAEAEYVGQCLVYARPDSAEAHAVLGRALASQRRWEELDAWEEALPPEAFEHPQVLCVQALRAEEAHDVRRAALLYYEALQRDPRDDRVFQKLAELLEELGSQALADRLRTYATSLAAYQRTVLRIAQSGPVVASLQQAARQAESLGRLWEARCWLTWSNGKALGDTGSLEAERLDQLLQMEVQPRGLVLPARHWIFQLTMPPEPRMVPEQAEAQP